MLGATSVCTRNQRKKIDERSDFPYSWVNTTAPTIQCNTRTKGNSFPVGSLTLILSTPIRNSQQATLYKMCGYIHGVWRPQYHLENLIETVDCQHQISHIEYIYIYIYGCHATSVTIEALPRTDTLIIGVKQGSPRPVLRALFHAVLLVDVSPWLFLFCMSVKYTVRGYIWSCRAHIKHNLLC